MQQTACGTAAARNKSSDGACYKVLMLPKAQNAQLDLLICVDRWNLVDAVLTVMLGFKQHRNKTMNWVLAPQPELK